LPFVSASTHGSTTATTLPGGTWTWSTMSGPRVTTTSAATSVVLAIVTAN
jgi:hypothetical protein